MRPATRVLLLTLALAATAHAGPADSLDPRQVSVRQQQLRGEILANDDKYKGLDAAQREQVLDRSARVLEILDGTESAAGLTTEERSEVQANLAWIERALAQGATQERMICRSEKTLGTNRRTRVCRTASQIESERADAQRLMTRPGVCSAGSPGCSGG